MKFIFALGLFLSVALQAQPAYQKMLGNTNDWYTSAGMFAVKSPNAYNWQAPCVTHYFANRDSAFNGHVYKIFEQANMLLTCSTPGDYTLIREDTVSRKLYIIPRDSIHEYLAYDFNMALGDSLFLPFYQNNIQSIPRGYFKLDSVNMKLEKIGPRRHFYLSNVMAPVDPNTNKRYYIEWVESIGALHFPLNLMKSQQLFFYDTQLYGTCPRDQHNIFVTCKYSDNKKYYFDSCAYNFYVLHPSIGHVVNDSCQYYSVAGGVQEYNNEYGIRTFPNPAKSTLQFSASNKGIDGARVWLQVFDARGQQVTGGSSTNLAQESFPVRSLDPGVYFIQVISLQGRIIFKDKFVKE